MSAPDHDDCTECVCDTVPAPPPVRLTPALRIAALDEIAHQRGGDLFAKFLAWERAVASGVEP